MKKMTALFLLLCTMVALVGCSNSSFSDQEPELSQMRNISQLATLDCYYHDVAKFSKEGEQKWLYKEADKNFWMEYSAIVSVGIDAQLVTMELDGDHVTITIPPGEVLSCKINSDSLTEDSFIVEKGSSKITADEEQDAWAGAESKLLEEVSEDQVLLNNAQERAMKLIEEYIDDIGEITEIDYSITWVYVDANGNEIKS